jgi:hypothetical protein
MSFERERALVPVLRIASILCMAVGAAVGAWLLRRSVALVLGTAGAVSAGCALAGWTRLARAEVEPLGVGSPPR